MTLALSSENIADSYSTPPSDEDTPTDYTSIDIELDDPMFAASGDWVRALDAAIHSNRITCNADYTFCVEINFGDALPPSLQTLIDAERL